MLDLFVLRTAILAHDDADRLVKRWLFRYGCQFQPLPKSAVMAKIGIPHPSKPRL